MGRVLVWIRIWIIANDISTYKSSLWMGKIPRVGVFLKECFLPIWGKMPFLCTSNKFLLFLWYDEVQIETICIS